MPGERKKPERPYPGFPLFAHAKGYWCKKIRGRQYSFGPWEDWRAALERYEREHQAIRDGVRPKPKPELVSLADCCESFMLDKERRFHAKELSKRSLFDYLRTTERMNAFFGRFLATAITVEQFGEYRAELAKTLGPVALGNELNRVRMVLRHAWTVGLVSQPIRTGTALDRPSAKTIRLARAEKGPRLFTAEQVWRLVNEGGDIGPAILLALNCGLGNADIGRLTWARIGRDGWLDYPRPKTGVGRRAWLWPETLERLPPRSAPSALLFRTPAGSSWHVEGEKFNPLSQAFRRAMDRLGIYRPGLGFYALRHTFATVAGESKDQVAVDHIMGHAPSSSDMRAMYREAISDQRLRDVAEVVRAWLLAGLEPQPGVGTGVAADSPADRKHHKSPRKS